MKAPLYLLGAIALAASGGHALSKPLPKDAQYVALGSSFAAGAGIGATKPDTPARCGRSQESYPTLLAQKLRLRLVDETCNGAKTTHLLGPWDELAAQLDAVGPDTRLITATIGGNDLNYAGYLISTSCGSDNMMAIGGRRFPCPSHDLPTEQDYARVESNMREIVRQARARAPKARFVFVQYVTLVPPDLCAAIPLTASQAKTAREIGRRLAQITDRVAKSEGADVIEANSLSQDHNACDAKPWSSGAQVAQAGDGMFWHPTRLAHAQIADALAKRLQR